MCHKYSSYNIDNLIISSERHIMNFKDYEASGTEKFFGENNVTIQAGLLVVTFLGFIYSAGLPPILNTVAVIIGLLIIASISILSSAHMYRYGIYNKYLNEDSQESANNKEAIEHLPIPDLRAFLIRSSIAFVIFIVASVILAMLGFVILIGGIGLLANFVLDNDQAIDFLSMGVIMVTIIPLFLMLLSSMVGIYVISPAIVDQYIYRNDLIRAHLYQADEKPITLAKMAEGLRTIIRYTLVLGTVMVLIVGMRFGLQLLRNSDAPNYIYYLVLCLLLLLAITFHFWINRRYSKVDAEKKKI